MASTCQRPTSDEPQGHLALNLPPDTSAPGLARAAAQRHLAGEVSPEPLDQGGGFEHEIRARGPDEVSGRGLFLVEALTNRWGIHEGTTHVWFELAARSDASRPPRPRLGQDERPQELD